ncbi:MAG: 5'-deoxynucleotidase [Oscillospiraceae bacterium]|nr:5'-deoxynucleotidase [Oscillospiraceae bacterium]
MNFYMNKTYSFFALISRMKYITRWSLMRNFETENVQEHSHMVAVIAHALAVIRRDIFKKDSDPGLVVSIALYHDSSEIFTGDLPTPVKYFDPEIMDAYKKVESVASKKLLTALPEELRPEYEKLLSQNENSEMHALVKAADKLSAYVKCLEELKAGNPEFRKAAEQTKEKLDALKMPEVEYFVEKLLPAFGQTLDELDFSFE